MAINALIASGGVNVGADVPNILNANYQRKRQQQQDALQNQVYQRQFSEEDQKKAEADRQQQAKQTLAETEWALQSPSKLQALSQMPHIMQALQKQGVDIRSLNEAQATQLAQTWHAKAASELGQGPPAPIKLGQNERLLQQGSTPGNYQTLFNPPPEVAYHDAGDRLVPVDKNTGVPIPGMAPIRKGLAPSAGAAGEKAPAGYKLNPDGSMSFIPGGPADPNKPQPTNFSGREAQMFQRVLSSASEANAAIKNIMELPHGATSGWMGVGASPGTGIFASVKGALTNQVSDQEVQDYESMMPGLGRALSTIETAGMAPNGSLMNQMGKLDLRKGDTGYTVLHKLAEYRQIVEKGIETNLDNPRIPKEQKQIVQNIIDEMKAAVPFTHHDVTELQRLQRSNPDLTMAQLAQQKGLGNSSQLPGNAPKVAKVTSDADYNALPSGTVFVGPDGKQRKKP